MRVNRWLQWPVRLWRATLGPMLPPSCRFYPSCSAYALEALERHPWPRALGLILWRLARCHPFHPGGYDPVPERQETEAARAAAPDPCRCTGSALHGVVEKGGEAIGHG